MHQHAALMSGYAQSHLWHLLISASTINSDMTIIALMSDMFILYSKYSVAAGWLTEMMWPVTI